LDESTLTCDCFIHANMFTMNEAVSPDKN